MAVETKTVYVASDGKTFDKHEDCVAYDNKLVEDREAKDGKLQRRMARMLNSKSLTDEIDKFPVIAIDGEGSDLVGYYIIKDMEDLRMFLMRLLQRRYDQDYYDYDDDAMATVEFILEHHSPAAAYDFLISRTRGPWPSESESIQFIEPDKI